MQQNHKIDASANNKNSYNNQEQVNEVGDADLLKFQEPVYRNGEWEIDANNKSGARANTIIVKDDSTVQIWNGPKTAMDHETKINL
ncbi:hypothetical protein [Mammaliicoccus sciuri]|uniref:hypothetical protein n=1 Tax=Mammaliicoccus sciuri TaxID=1296 RepID=UPI003F559ED4